MLYRSALVLLLVATTATAQTRLTRDPAPPAKYSLGADSLPQKDVPKGKLSEPVLFKSKIIKDTVRKYWVHVPAQYDGKRPACVLVFQDGARAINPTGVLRVPQVLDNLIAKKQIPVTIGIFITPGQKGDTFPDTIGTGNPDNRSVEYDSLGDAYARMVVEEILPEVGKTYKLATEPENRAIGGSSSGGICAFTVAWEKPKEFRNVISLIGSFTDLKGGHVYPDLIKKADAKPLRVFLQDGELDNRSPLRPSKDWYLQNQKMIAALKEKKYDFAEVVGKGGHSDDHGGAMLPYMLRWVWRDHKDVAKSDDDLVKLAATMKPDEVKLFPDHDPKAKTDPVGKYTWEEKQGRFTIAITLQVEKGDGGKLFGLVQVRSGNTDLAPRGIGDVVMDGNKLMFAMKIPIQDGSIEETYQGVVTDTGVRGWVMRDNGKTPNDTAWTAKKAK